MPSLFSGGDQGLLNTFFSDWAVRDISKHLPFVYNLSAITVYTYLPAYQEWVIFNFKWIISVNMTFPWLKSIFWPQAWPHPCYCYFAWCWPYCTVILVPHRYGHNAKIVHFLGSVKPWNLRSNSQTNQHTSSHLEEFVYQWWMEYSYLHLLIKTMSHQEPAVPIQHAGPKQHVRRCRIDSCIFLILYMHFIT